MRSPSYSSSVVEMASFGSTSGAGSMGISMPSYYDGGIAADVPVTNRMVVQNSSLSLLVKDVKLAGDSIIKKAETEGGFMVSSDYNRPNDSPYANISVRVPSDKLNATLEYFRSQAIEVVSENLIGKDVTEQYVNIESRLSSLERVKTKFEGILDNATLVQDILTVQRELINTQTQIDNLMGQKKALEENASYVKITVYLSTDELSLPYAPDTKFRPDVIFKLAVRSMLGTLQKIGELAIWLAVYSIVWVPVLLVVIIYRRWKARKLVKTS